MESSTYEVESLKQHILNHIWQSIVLTKTTENTKANDCGSSIQKKSFHKSNGSKKEISSRNSNNDRSFQKVGVLSDDYSTSTTEVRNRTPVRVTTDDLKSSTCIRRKHECDVGLTAKCIDMCNCVQRLFTAATRKLSKKRKKYLSSLKEEGKDAKLEVDERPVASLNIDKNVTLNDCLSVGLDPPYLEKCLKDAIATVLLSLPEDYDLVEHSSSLFVFLLEFISSSPRPDYMQSAAILAILEAHTTKPCEEDEILALNNPHPALYVALKLCSVRWGRSTTGPVSRRYMGSIYEKNNTKAQKLVENEIESNIQAIKNNNFNSKPCTVYKNIDVVSKHTTSDIIKSDSLKTEERDCQIEKCVNTEEKGSSQTLNEISLEEKKNLVVDVLTAIHQCERSFKRLMMCLLQESIRAAERGWCCDNEFEQERVQDLRFFLYYAQYVEDCSVSELVSNPLWVTGSCPVEVAARWGTPGLLLTLLQHGAGASDGHIYSRCPRSHFRRHLWKRCIARDHLTAKDGVYMAIASLISKLDRQVRESESSTQLLDSSNNESRLLLSANKCSSATYKYPTTNLTSQTENLLVRAGNSPVGTCLRYLLRAVPHVPAVFLRDHSSECSNNDVASLLPRTACTDPPSLCQLARASLRITLRTTAKLPQAIYILQIPYPLKDYLNLLTD